MSRIEAPGLDRDGREAARLLCALARRVRLVACATPLELGAELSRVGAAWAAGREEAPRFSYARAAGMAELRRELGAAMSLYRGPLRELYAGRVRELSIEAAACEVVGTPAFRERARERFPRRDAFDEEADRLAERWAGGEARRGAQGAAVGEGAQGAAAGEGAQGAAGEVAGEGIVSDDEGDPRSLLCAMRRAVGEHRLAVRVIAARRMAPLAATGDGVIYVATGRRLSASEAARTVVHEVIGHALPSERAKRAAVPLFELGTAFGSDDQEGRALLVEERAGLLSAGRRHELALRHLAVRAMEAGAGFVEVVRLLLGRGAAVADAVRIAARVLRGGGLGREGAYLPALLRVRAAFAEAPALEEVLASGRISVDAARIMAGGGTR